MRSYRNMTAYQLARELVAQVYGTTGEIGASGPATALRRAAITATAKLVEGSSQPSPADYLRCLATARAALAEFPLHVNLCQLRGQLSPQAASALLADQSAASAELGRLIAEAETPASSKPSAPY